MEIATVVKPLILAIGTLVSTAALGADQDVTTGSPGYGAVARPDRTTSGPNGGIPDFNQMDKNGDGVIDRQELDSAQKDGGRNGGKGGVQSGTASGRSTGTVGGNPAAATGTGKSAAETIGSVGGDGSAGSRQAPR